MGLADAGASSGILLAARLKISLTPGHDTCWPCTENSFGQAQQSNAWIPCLSCFGLYKVVPSFTII